MVRSIREAPGASRRVRVATAALLLVGAFWALAPAVIAADSTVDIAGFSFSPGSLTVSVGDAVTWTNADAQSHTATSDSGAFDTGTIAGSASKSVTLTTAGTFPYHCAIHPAMTATLVVQAASGGGSAPPPTDTAASSLPERDAGPSLLALVALGGAWLAGAWLGLRRFRRPATVGRSR